MRCRIVWEGSGDDLLFSATFPDLMCYYVEQLNALQANRFKFRFSKFDRQALLDLEQNLLAVSKVAQKIPLEIDQWDGDLLDQQYLNKLHQQWVKTGTVYPKITTFLRSVNGLDKDYRGINNNLHLLESSFKFHFVNYDTDPFRIKNIFGSDILSFNVSNLTLGFDNLGRSSWEKYKNWDNDIKDTDHNNYQMLGGLVYLNLDRPATQQPPLEYVNWCKQHNAPVVGNRLNLGNIVDLETRLTDLRKILIRNTHEQDNRFFFEICS